MTKTGIVLAVAAAVIALPLFAGLASADSASGGITLAVQQGRTDRLGGGEWIVIQAGNTNFGVVYGTSSSPNKLYIFAEQKRYLAGVDIYDAQGNLIRTKGIPVWTVYAQSLDRMIEFKDTDNNSRFDMRVWEDGLMGIDRPMKGLNLIRGWTMTGLMEETVNDVLYVNFTLSVTNVYYTWVWNTATRRPVPATPADGQVEEIAFTFHIRVSLEDATAEVPWFKVIVAGGDERRVLNHTFEGWREISGQKVNMSVKYDHEFLGWDFASDESKLLLETKLMFGRVVPRELIEQYRQREGGRAFEGEDGERQGTELCNDESESPREPREVSTEERRGTITFSDDWYRIGRFTWESNVTVDGENEDMYFQIHGGGPISFEFNRAWFVGLYLIGAFVYPAGDEILHDPGFDAASYEFIIPTITNLAPMTVLFLQVLLVIMAVVLAIVVRQLRKGRKR